MRQCIATALVMITSVFLLVPFALQRTRGQYCASPSLFHTINFRHPVHGTLLAEIYAAVPGPSSFAPLAQLSLDYFTVVPPTLHSQLLASKTKELRCSDFCVQASKEPRRVHSA